VFLLKDKSGQTACHMAAERGNVEVLEKLWDWAKELQLNPEELRNIVCLSKDNSVKRPGINQH
jgi:ankyrin repeat protein